MIAAEILVVDDDPRVRDLLSRYLEGEGYKVGFVEHGDAMRRHLANSPVDLVVLDLNLSGEDGLLLAALIHVGWISALSGLA
jgi:two-component system phosphate regulon response regulator OmpR